MELKPSYVPAGAEVAYRVDVAGLPGDASPSYIWQMDGVNGEAKQEVKHTYNDPGEYKPKVEIQTQCGSDGYNCGALQIEVPVRAFSVELLDEEGKDVTVTNKDVGLYLVDRLSGIGNSANFIPGTTMKMKYKIVPEEYGSEVKLSDIPVTVTMKDATDTWDGEARHNMFAPLATSTVYSSETEKSIMFDVRFSRVATDSEKKAGSTLKTVPLAFDLSFNYGKDADGKDKPFRTFRARQSDRNTLRSEYAWYGTTNIPKMGSSGDDFSTSVIDAYYPPDTGAYATADVPRGDKINNLVGFLNTSAEGLFVITSTYRNPSRNAKVSNTGLGGRHVWSGAFDVDAMDQDKLNQTWQEAAKIGQYNQVLVESRKQQLRDIIYAKINGLNATVPASSDIGFSSVYFASTNFSAGVSDLYAVVWRKSDGWGVINFFWVQEDSAQCPSWSTWNNFMCHASYQVEEADWDTVAGNLHIQDTRYNEEGF